MLLSLCSDCHPTRRSPLTVTVCLSYCPYPFRSVIDWVRPGVKQDSQVAHPAAVTAVNMPPHWMPNPDFVPSVLPPFAFQSVIDLIRPTIEAALSGRATCTTALSGMLEVLPVGASKGAGVQWLLNHLGISPSGLLALGDGENDIEMLQLAAVGVAMGNAGPKVKAVADAVTASNDDDGVAKAIHEYVLKPRQLSEGRAVVQVQSGAAQQH